MPSNCSPVMAPERQVFQPALSSSTSTRSGASSRVGGAASSSRTACALAGTSTNQPKATDASTTQSADSDTGDSALLTTLPDQGRPIQLPALRWGLASQQDQPLLTSSC